MPHTTVSKPKKSAMAQALAQEGKQSFPKVGELVKAKVISVGKSEIFLDINGVITGTVRGKELEDESGEYSNLHLGDEVEATVLELENEQGLVELSFRYAGHQRAWDALQKMKIDGVVVPCKVIDANKGGMMCKVGGVIGFLPVSQLTPEHYPRVEGGDKNKILEILKGYIGRDFEVKIIDVDEREEKLILSEKSAWEERQRHVLEKYKVGDVVKGKVTGVVNFGVFVEFAENVEGLVHISELAWQRIDDPRDVVKVGDEVKVKIIAIEGSKISLSMKVLQEDPWKNVDKKYHVGDVIEGKVLKLNPFGAFVELDSSIHGLAHLSELSSHEIKDASEVLEVGKVYKFKVVSLEPKEHRLGLSIKALKNHTRQKGTAVGGEKMFSSKEKIAPEKGGKDQASAKRVEKEKVMEEKVPLEKSVKKEKKEEKPLVRSAGIEKTEKKKKQADSA